MTELTPREILDAIDRALEKAARHVADDKPEGTRRPSESEGTMGGVTKQGSQVQRQN